MYELIIQKLQKLLIIQYLTLSTGVVKPGETTTAATMGGYEGHGNVWANDLTGTTIKGDGENLSNGDKVTFTYTLKPGYAWEDGTTAPATSVYTVVGLHPGLTDPTTTSAKIEFTGTSGKGTFVLPTYTNTTSAYVESGGQTTKTVPTNLKMGIQLRYCLLLIQVMHLSLEKDTMCRFIIQSQGFPKVSMPSKNAFSEKLDSAVSGLLGKPANLY